LHQFGQRCGDALLAADCHVVAGPGATVNVTRPLAGDAPWRETN
jgi:hypothetical protein